MNYKEILETKLQTIFHNEHYRAKVADALLQYGKTAEEEKPFLVRLAILKNAGVEFEAIEATIAIAKSDFRHVLDQAEFPRQTANQNCRDRDQMMAFMDEDQAEWTKFLKY
tara:strand:+ start:1035 stop:1367 length:333 start_codon:yes stop_codon:yes gene_type:complete